MNTLFPGCMLQLDQVPVGVHPSPSKSVGPHGTVPCLFVSTEHHRQAFSSVAAERGYLWIPTWLQGSVSVPVAQYPVLVLLSIHSPGALMERTARCVEDL